MRVQFCPVQPSPATNRLKHLLVCLLLLSSVSSGYGGSRYRAGEGRGGEGSAELGNILSEPKIPSLVTCVTIILSGQVLPASTGLVISLLSALSAQTSHRRRRFRRALTAADSQPASSGRGKQITIIYRTEKLRNSETGSEETCTFSIGPVSTLSCQDKT